VKPLTNDQSVTALHPKSARYAVRDSKVAGLELRVRPDGVKTWTLRYRAKAGADAGKQKRLVLGRYPRMTLASARVAANEELRRVDAGDDPQAARQAEKVEAARQAADSIDILCETYLARHARLKKRSWRADAGLLKNKVLVRWKGRAVSGITRRDCRELVQSIADGGAPVVANRVVALLSRLFRFALDEEIIEHSPAVKLPKPGVEAAARPDGEREVKPYSDEELRALWKATETLEPAPRAIYRIGLLTGQRPNEVLNLHWTEIAGAWWTLPAARSKNRREHRIYLTRLALDELTRVPRVDDEARVFANYRGKRQLAALNRRVFAGVRSRLRPRHALRDTVATRLAQAGVSIETIAHVLNHSHGPAVTSGYNAYGYDKEKRAALETWARALTAILANGATAAKVTPIAAARKGA
jgi:integrase